MSELLKLDVVIGNNFGHLPMFVGADKGFFDFGQQPRRPSLISICKWRSARNESSVRRKSVRPKSVSTGNALLKFCAG
jgi:hypothetical protein